MIDGDTFSSDGKTYRLWGVDAPERGQPWSAVATAALREILLSGEFEIDSRHGLSYDREVVLVKVNGIDVGLTMLQMGLAWHDARYARKRVDYSAISIYAIQNKIGIWSSPKPIPPWIYRKQIKIQREK